MKRGDVERRHSNKSGSAYGQAAPPELDRRAQRDLDRALGLVPFAVKLPQELVKTLQQRASDGKIGLNELTAELLKKSLSK